MLTLRCHPGESVVIGGSAFVTVIEESTEGGSHVRLRIDDHGDTREVRVPVGSWRTVADGVECSYRGHKSSQAILGFSAERSVSIDRKEIHDRKLREVARQGFAYGAAPA